MRTCPSPGLKPSEPVPIRREHVPHLPPCLSRSHGARPLVGTEGSEHTASRCWISCYFSRPTGPQPARVGVGGSGDRTCRAGVGGQNFPVFYPFATWSPIERNGTLRANRRGWPGSGPPARPLGVPARGGEGKSSRNQRRNRRGRGSCQQTRLHHVTRHTQKHTLNAHGCTAGKVGAGGEEGAGGHPSCPLRGRLGVGQGECIEHIMYTRSRRKSGASTHRHMGWTRSVLRERQG